MPTSSLRELSLAGLLCLFGHGCATPEPPPVADLDPAPETPLVLRRHTFDHIARLEDARSDGDGELERLAFSTDPLVRARATRALGRLAFPAHGSQVSVALLRALSDSDPKVRAVAAFGLGLRADPATARGLLAAWKDEDANVRARIVEAGSRFEDARVREEVMYSLSDPAPLVRVEAATAPHRWKTDSNTADDVDFALRDIAAKAPAVLIHERWGERTGALDEKPEDMEVVRAALFSLARRKASPGQAVFLLWCRAPGDALARLFATRGLAALETATAETKEALRQGLADEDWRVIVEAAAGLQRFPDPASVPHLERALSHPLANVRGAVTRSLGFYANERLQVRPLLDRMLTDTSPNVRGNALRALAQLYGAEVREQIEANAAAQEPMVRKAVAECCEFLPASVSVFLLTHLSDDNDRAVAYAAALGLGPFLKDGGRARAHELLSSPDMGLRLGAVMALQVDPTAQDLAPLLHCYKTSQGDIADELRYEILNTAVKLPDDRAFEILNEGLRADQLYGREFARKLLDERFPDMRTTDAEPLQLEQGELPSVDLLAANPRVEVHTSRGTMVFELFPAEAPVHVHNFLTLVRRGAYNGLRFHRVVANFVVQGGDYRGDGNGGQTWRGLPLRHEFNERKYVEGSLGMPRNSDPESGGSQFFVTHCPTPHLDGRYTLFGELRQGEEVLRSIEEDDRILGVRVRGE